MGNQINHWIDQRLPGDIKVSQIQAWVRTDSSWELYYFHVTTNLVDEFIIDNKNEPIYIVSKNTSVEAVPGVIPEEELSRESPAHMEIECIGESDYRTERKSEFRIERSYSSDTDQFAARHSALRVEWWIDEEDRPDCPTGIENQVHSYLKEQCKIDLAPKLDYRGNFIIVLEDKRIRFRSTESPEIKIVEEIFDQDLDIVLEWQEYGDTIWSESFSANQIQNSDDVSDDGSMIIKTIVGDQEYRIAASEFYRTNSVLKPGASDVRIKIVQDGITLDQNDYPLIRVIDSNIQLEGSEEESGPPKLHHQSPTDRPGTSFATGEHIWDSRRLSHGSQNENRGWCTNANEVTVTDALSTIQAEIGSIVKIVDPYMSDDEIIDFIDSIDGNVNVWVITSEPVDTSSLDNQLEHWNAPDRKVEILRVIDSNGASKQTPLHDRFLLTDGQYGQASGWTLGTSFNSLDLNTSIISEIPLRLVNQLDIEFNSWWYEPIEERHSSNNCRKTFKNNSEYIK